MKRQSFLQMAGIGLLAIPAFATAAGNRNKKIKRPPYLQPGNTIGITCPAGFSLLETIQPSIDLIQSWGYQGSTRNYHWKDGPYIWRN
jgi:muramoyltetrapeptide carboxypeptidase